jgi:hypothetical protein
MTTLTISARRDVKAMTSLFETMDFSRPLSAAFKDELYGIFSVEGYAYASSLSDDLLIAGLALASKGKPGRNVQHCDYADSPGTENALTLGGSGIDTADALRRIEHGDLVRVAISQEPYGLFAVTGLAVQTSQGNLLVGSWFVLEGGMPSARVQSAEIIASAGEHGMAIPPAITSWRSTDTP